MAGARKDRTWIVGGVVAAVAIAAAGWFLLISPQFGAAAGAGDQLADVQTQNIVLQKRLDTLQKKSSHTDDLTAELQNVYGAIPPRHDLEGFTRQLTVFAKDVGVTITSISPGAPTLITMAETAAPSTEAADGAPGVTKGASPSDSSSDAAAPTTEASAGPAGNLYSITVTVVTTGPMAAQQKFLSAIEKQGDRRALVTATAFSPITDADGASTPTDGVAVVTPSATEGQWTLTTNLAIFVAPQSPNQEAQLLSQLGGKG